MFITLVVGQIALLMFSRVIPHMIVSIVLNKKFSIIVQGSILATFSIAKVIAYNVLSYVRRQAYTWRLTVILYLIVNIYIYICILVPSMKKNI